MFSWKWKCGSRCTEVVFKVMESPGCKRREEAPGQSPASLHLEGSWVEEEESAKENERKQPERQEKNQVGVVSWRGERGGQQGAEVRPAPQAVPLNRLRRWWSFPSDQLFSLVSRGTPTHRHNSH